MKKIKDTDLDARVYGPSITAVLSYSKGFACALATGTVYLFEKFPVDSYKRSREIQVNGRQDCCGTASCNQNKISVFSVKKG